MADEKIAKYCDDTKGFGFTDGDKMEEVCKGVDGAEWDSFSKNCLIGGKAAICHGDDANVANHLQVRYILGRNF